MSNKNADSMLDESLSALMDGEAQELELRRILHGVPDQSASRSKWARYQLVSSLLRQQACLPVVSLEVADAVQLAIGQSEIKENTGKHPESRHSSLARFAVAASVALAVVVGVQWGQHQQSNAQMAVLSQSPAVSNKQPVSPLLPVGQQVAKDSVSAKEAPQDLFMQYGFDRAVMDSSSMPLTPATAKINAR